MGSQPRKKIKIIMVAGKLDVTGISTVIMNYCSHLDLSKFEVLIVAGNPIAEVHRDTCKKLGIRLFELPNRWNNSKAYYKKLNEIVKQERPDILHVHGNSATMAIELFIAWIHGVKIRISHCHNTTSENLKRHKMMLPLFNKLYTQAFACGKKAGEWLYNDKKFYVIPNGFITERFVYNEEARKRVRTELGIDHAFVIGHIGRFNEQKNQPFLIKTFEQLAEKRDDVVLMLVGIGPDFEKTSELVKKSPYKDRIILYGETNSPEDMYSAMDVFVMPSRYEGLPVVLVEAECSGLYCIISDVVTDEMSIDHHIQKISLDAPLQDWCDAIESVPSIDRKAFYYNNVESFNQYDINADAKRLEQLYMDFCMNRR